MAAACALPVWLLLTTAALAQESPTSDGPISILDTPIFRIPRMRRTPTIDGVMAAGEWQDASALSSFWYRDDTSRFLHLAPIQTQLQVYAGFDAEHLYFAYRSPVYPERSWLRARGRFPDVYNHPQYGLLRDDHVELELRPWHDARAGYKLGMFKWIANPIAVFSDQYWTVQTGQGRKWQSKAAVRSAVTDKLWTIEFKIPLKEMKVGNYAGKRDGREMVKIPPSDGTAFRCWFARAVNTGRRFFNAFDAHVWNTTKTKLIFDATTVACQINELGAILEDVIDVQVTLKNHSPRSQTVRLGFFVENADGLIDASYEDRTTKNGLVELVPGQARVLRLKKKFPGITKQGNFLWFDIRTSGRPAEVLFQTRLVAFHSMDPGPPYERFRERKIDVIATMRPPKRDFDFRYQYSPYTGRLSAVVDRGIHGASDAAQRAVEAQLTLMAGTEDEKVLTKRPAPFQGDFATFLLTDLGGLKKGHYKVSLLLFDANKRIVGERDPGPFYKGAFDWEKNRLGTDDVVWTPFVPMRVSKTGFETLNHVFTVAPSGLPAQISIKPDPRELPLAPGRGRKKLTPGELLARGRGPQLRAPLRLEAVVAGRRLPMTVVKPARLVRKWKSELEYVSKLRVGPLDVDLTIQYDCDGSMTLRMTYGADRPVKVDRFELLMDVAGPVDMRLGGKSHMFPNSGMELTLPEGEGVVWDAAKNVEAFELYYSRFNPYLHFGSADRAFTYFCDSDEGWVIDRAGSTMTLERNKAGEVTWRTMFVNHAATIDRRRTIELALLTHPAKPKEPGYRRVAWLDWRPANLEGIAHRCHPNDGPGGIDGSDRSFSYFLKRYPNGTAPRLYMLYNWVSGGIPALQKGAYTGEWLGNSGARMDRTPMDSKGAYGQPWIRPGRSGPRIQIGKSWEDYTVYQLEREIRIGRVKGWWWDELFLPMAGGNTVATGGAHFRDPKDVRKQELPWQSHFASFNARGALKRLARLFKTNNVPNYSYLWANTSSTLESYASDSMLIESTAAYSKSYDLDNLARFPISFFRFACNTNRGLSTRIVPNIAEIVYPGDDPSHDRIIVGRALLHDIGVDVTRLSNVEQGTRALNILYDFGIFDEASTEVIPYWRGKQIVRYGPEFVDDGFATTTTNPYEDVHVTVYRRPYKTSRGRTGTKALFVVMNEGDKPLRARLQILDPMAVFGGRANNLQGMDVRDANKVPAGTWITRAHQRSFRGSFGPATAGPPVLKDMEQGGAVLKTLKSQTRGDTFVNGEIYGPVHLPARDFRILYGHYDPDKPTDLRGLGAAAKAIQVQRWREAQKKKQGK